jgi:plastocyanin
MAYSLRALALSVLLVVPALFLAGCSAAPSQAGASRNAAQGGTAESPDKATSATVLASAPGAADQERAAAKKPGAEKPADPNRVMIDNFAFSPRTLTVATGTKVTWVNHDDVPHTATSTARLRVFDSRTLDTDDQFAHVFTTPGTYPYFCAVHPHMTGTIIVK